MYLATTDVQTVQRGILVCSTFLLQDALALEHVYFRIDYACAEERCHIGRRNDCKRNPMISIVEEHRLTEMICRLGKLESGHLPLHAMRRPTQKTGSSYLEGEELEHGHMDRRAGGGRSSRTISRSTDGDTHHLA